MQPSDATHNESIYRLLLIPEQLGDVFGEDDGGAVRLPRVHISFGSRPASQIQRAARELWGIDILVLDFMQDSEGIFVCAIAQLLSRECPKGLTPVTWEQLPLSELDHPHRRVVDEIGAGDPGERGPLSRVGWIDEAKEWIAAETGCPLPLDAVIEQHNAGGGFALLRLARPDGPAYWLKATRGLNRHEFDVTVMLAAICPEGLPQMIAARRDWNAWLMEDAGTPLTEEASLVALECATVTVAELQKKTIAHTEHLLAAGATDQRPEVLRTHAGKVAAYLEEAMEQQTSNRVPKIEASRLREIGTILGDACLAMEVLDVPDTVIHNDPNRGNLLFRDGKYVLTDWSEAGVGNPFLTFQHLLLMLGHGDDPGDSARLHSMQAYKRCWVDLLEPWKVEQAFRLMPLLAIYSHLYGRGDWIDSPRGRDPRMQSYARSLARHMYRASQSAPLRDALCH
jgi:hypothetical protein